jgi:hypothetical protein
MGHIISFPDFLNEGAYISQFRSCLPRGEETALPCLAVQGGFGFAFGSAWSGRKPPRLMLEGRLSQAISSLIG